MRQLLLIILVVFILTPSNVEAKKRKKKKSFLAEWYHNTTARYNGLFYAKLTMSESEFSLTEGQKTDFNKLIEIYPTVSSPDKQSISSGMETIIEKCEKVIQKHRRSKWVDNANYLIGKAYLYLGEHEKAIQSFLYITSDYYNKDDDGKKKIRKKKKKKGKKGSQQEAPASIDELLEKYHLNHKHSNFEAIEWLLITFVEHKDFQKAMIIADLVLGDETLSDRDKARLFKVQSHIYIKQENYKGAILPLKKAILLSNKKKDKIKLKFLLGQIYLELEQMDAAQQTFNEVLELKPSYDFEFNAKLKIASASQGMASGTNANIKKLIFEMIEDEKNEDQLDQLYYTLGNIAISENDEEKAMNYYKKSIELSTSNKHQKGLTFLKMGEVHLIKGRYLPAAVEYDSCVALLDKDYKDLESTYFIQNQLFRLKLAEDNIAFQDSVQEVAGMDSLIVEEMIQERIEAQKAKIEREEQELLAKLNAQANTDDNTSRLSGGRRASQWYFYNDNAKTIGKQTFQKSWGIRKLEDHWRRKNKDSGNGEDEEDEEAKGGDESQLLDPAYYRSQIPNTPEKVEASNQSIRQSLFDLGVLFRDEIQNNDQAIRKFEELIKRFPNDDDLVRIYFYLYLTHLEEKNTSQSNYYKNLILSQYPDSDIAKSFTQSISKDAKDLNYYYQNAYNHFDLSNYEQTIAHSDAALKQFPSSLQEANLLFLKAKSYGYIDRKDSMIKILQYIVKDHPEAPIKEQAEMILSALSNSNEFNKDTYIFRPTDRHFICFIMDDQNFNSSNITVDLSAFNKKVFNRKDYQLVNIQFGKDRMVIVKSFESKNDADEYQKALKKDSKMKKVLKSVQHDALIVGKSNYTILMNTLDLKKYKAFYQEYYK